MNFNEFETKFNNLPELSKRAMAKIVAGLYAEPGFSDYDTKDLARDLNVPATSVGGIMARLEADGLAFSAELEINRIEVYQMIECPAHSDDNEDSGDWDKIRELCIFFEVEEG